MNNEIQKLAAQTTQLVNNVVWSERFAALRPEQQKIALNFIIASITFCVIIGAAGKDVKKRGRK